MQPHEFCPNAKAGLMTAPRWRGFWKTVFENTKNEQNVWDYFYHFSQKCRLYGLRWETLLRSDPVKLVELLNTNPEVDKRDEYTLGLLEDHRKATYRLRTLISDRCDKRIQAGDTRLTDTDITEILNECNDCGIRIACDDLRHLHLD